MMSLSLCCSCSVDCGSFCCIQLCFQGFQSRLVAGLFILWISPRFRRPSHFIQEILQISPGRLLRKNRSINIV